MGLQHSTSQKLAEANILLNIKKTFFYVSGPLIMKT